MGTNSKQGHGKGTKKKSQKKKTAKESGGVIYFSVAFIGIALAMAAGVWLLKPVGKSETISHDIFYCLTNGCDEDVELPRCGAVVAPTERIAQLVREVLLNPLDVFMVIDTASSDHGVVLVRSGNRSTLLAETVASGTEKREAVVADEAALALGLECDGSVRESSRIQALRSVVAAVSANDDSGNNEMLQPFVEAQVMAWRESLKSAGVESVDVRGLWQDTFLPSAVTMRKSESPLLRSARLCNARAVRVWLQLGANPNTLIDNKGRRALDLALLCDSRALFPTAADLIEGCGLQCFSSPNTKDQIGPIHRILTRWAAAHFPTRPKPNPFNLLLDRALRRVSSLQDGQAALLATTAHLETPLHVAVAKRNVEGTRLLLAALERLNVLRKALDFRDGLGGHTPLAIAFAWKTWAVTVPRILTGNGGDASDLKLQALDGDDALCVQKLAATLSTLQSVDKTGGMPLIKIADTLASECGFLGALPMLLLDSGARIDTIDDYGLPPLAHAHPCLVGECDKDTDESRKIVEAIQRAANRDNIDLTALLAATAANRNLWHRHAAFFSNITSLDDVHNDLCDAVELSPTTNEVSELLLKRSVPAIVRGALDASWDQARVEWMPSQLRASARGAETVRVGTIPYASAFAVDERIASVVDAIDSARTQSRAAMAALTSQSKTRPQAPNYLFEQIRWNSFRDHALGALVHDNTGSLHPMLPNTTVKHNAQFYIGHPLSGAPVHYHSHAANALIHGLKRWLLFPPAHSFYSKEPAIDWLETGRLQALRDANISFLTCLQPPDSVLFLPAGWGHATLNLAEDTVGAAYEFHFPGELVWSMEDRATHLVSTTRRL